MAAHITKHFLPMVGNGIFPASPPVFYNWVWLLFPGKSCLVSSGTLHVRCHARQPYPGTLRGALQKADLCGAENPMLSPKMYDPKPSLRSQKAKITFGKTKTAGWRGPVGNSSMLIHNRLSGPRCRVCGDQPHACTHPEEGWISAVTASVLERNVQKRLI